MTSLSSLAGFILSEIDGTCWDDPSYRAYDLEWGTGQSTLKGVLRLLRRSELEIADDLVNMGIPLDDLKGRLVRWYVWYRLSCGRIRKWKLRVIKP